MRPCSARASSLATAWTAVLGALASACGGSGDGAPTPFGDARMTVSVAPLDLGADIGDAIFAMKVIAPDGTIAWNVPELSAANYGSGGGGFAYVGPCESGTTYRIELVLLRLLDAAGHDIPANTWHNPTSAERPLVQESLCRADADLPVSFALDLARTADQGFFDIGVEFDDVFCSAKIDCADDTGAPLKLLYRGDGTRGDTVVMGFACTSGNGPTWLYLDQLEVVCDDPGGTGSSGGTGPLWVDPQAPEGNTGSRPPALFETAVYHGVQMAGSQPLCYWNAALGVDVGAYSRNCVLRTRGTAANALWSAGVSPADHVYPYIDFEVTLTDAQGQLQCGHQAVAGDGPVRVRYSDGVTPLAFDRSRACGFETVAFPRDLECDNVGNLENGVTFTDLGAGRFDVRFGDDHLAEPLNLPLGRSLSTCCSNPCCGGD